MTKDRPMRLFSALVLAAILFAPALAARAGAPAAQAHAEEQGSFPTPEDAATALLSALLSGQAWEIEAVIGQGGVGLLSSGDKLADQEEVRHFIEAYADRHRIVRQGDGRAALVIGPKDWTLPIPLVRDASGWHFDTADAARQITNRRIGRNEIGAIRGLLAMADAQRAYRDTPDGPHAYAMRLISANGQRDGLYWPDAAFLPRSPLAKLADAERARGYSLSPTELPESYGGYRMRLLTAAGPNAPGGARNFLVNGRLAGGFAYIAWPVRYGTTGVMTFLLGPDGSIFQKDLGARTDEIVDATKSYDPDLSWALVRVAE
jgi:hypothetical protein